MSAQNRSPSKVTRAAKDEKQGPVIRIAKVKSLSDKETLVRVTSDGRLSSKDAERCGQKKVAEFVGVPAKSWAQATKLFRAGKGIKQRVA